MIKNFAFSDRGSGWVMKVEITQKMMVRAAWLAQDRNDKPESTNRRFHPETKDYDAHFMSALVECAWEELTGWPVDGERLLEGDGGIDFTNAGRTYQVKARNLAQYSKPDLLCRVDYAKADRYILGEIDMEEPEEVNFVGWCSRDDLTSGNTVDFGYGPRYVVGREDLRQWK